MAAENQETEDQDSIDVSADPDDVDPEATAAEPETRQGERPSKANRRNRYQELKTEAEQKTQLLEQERQARIQDQQRMNALQQQLNQLQGQQQGQNYDPIDYALTENFRARQSLDKEFQARAGKLSEKELEEMQWKAQSLEDQRAMLNVQKVQRATPQVDPQIQALESYAAANHPEIVNSQQARAYFQGELVRKAALAQAQGRQIDGVAIFRESLEQTEKDLKIGKHRNGGGVDPGLAARLAGHSRGAASNGGSAPLADRVTMTDQYKVMAETAFPELVKAKGARAAHERWAQTVGKKLISQGVKLNS